MSNVDVSCKTVHLGYTDYTLLAKREERRTHIVLTDK